MGYAVSVPTAAFLALLWMSRISIAVRPPAHPIMFLGTALVVLLVPLAGTPVGVGAIVSLIAQAAAGAVVVTVVLGTGSTELVGQGRDT